MLMRRPLPKIKGKLHVQGLHEPVEVITDRYGVPHIYAGNEDDLFFAQGYVHAQERLWQMEFNRRLGSGRLSELFGDVALDVDRFCRRLGMHRAAAAEVERRQNRAGASWPLMLTASTPLSNATGANCPSNLRCCVSSQPPGRPQTAFNGPR